jgi:diguanylate cyclase (GGDEF)-like protein/PAS domain S-box-containing protein
MNETLAPMPPSAGLQSVEGGAETMRPGDTLPGALLDSRERWRDMVAMSADFAFETDAWGRFTFIAPDQALGWPKSTLLGQTGQVVLADPPGAAGFDPFRVSAPVRRRRAWLKRADGGVACVSFCAAPLTDAEGHLVGVRGVGIDITDRDGEEAQIASALRRCELLDHMLWRMRREVLAPKMMQSILESLANALGAEGVAVIDVMGSGGGPVPLHVTGGGIGAILSPAAALIEQSNEGPGGEAAIDGRPLLVCPCQTRFGEQIGLAVWRTSGSRAWDAEDRVLVGSTTGIVRVVLEHAAIQREMARHARTDPLTGLLNRRAFFDEIARYLDRLDREGLPGTLMFVDLDNFKPLNDRLGHDVGDEALTICSALLCNTVRPSDLVARVGGDEFALWLNGADHMTAAERAESLRVNAPRDFAGLVGDLDPPLTLSIGIATRAPGGGESIDSLMRRADQAMYDVKRSGRGHWRVSQAPPLP